ncbi:MAG: lactate utilization protein C, partial [Dehalococcoidia bacterium]
SVAGTSRPCQSEGRAAHIAAVLAITEVDYPFADTGSLVLLAGEHQSRLVSLLPPVHVALLKPSAIVPSMADLLPVLNAAARENPGRLSNCITFITGPSRTADIEKTLTVGIHGPTEVHLLILEYLG